MPTLLPKARKPLSFSSANADYGRQVRNAIRGLWREQFTIFDFVDSMVSTIQRGYRQAFYAGAGECGILPSELTFEETNSIQEAINSDIAYLYGLADAIYQGRRSQGKRLTPLLKRGMIWENNFSKMYNMGKRMACGDQKLMWVINPRKEHCADCVMLNGRIHRASVWDRSGWEPQGRDLACGGFRCGCKFVVTSLPALPGLPPRKA